MRQASKRIPDSAEKTVRDIRDRYRAAIHHHTPTPPCLDDGDEAGTRRLNVNS